MWGYRVYFAYVSQQMRQEKVERRGKVTRNQCQIVEYPTSSLCPEADARRDFLHQALQSESDR